MACPAVCDITVGSLQNGARLFMVEILGVQDDEISVRPLVFRVADRTVFLFIPMIAALSGDSIRDLNMTGEAAGSLDLKIIVVTFKAFKESWCLGVGWAKRAWGVIGRELLRQPPWDQAKGDDHRQKSGPQNPRY
jgi:hypothetical protein